MTMPVQITIIGSSDRKLEGLVRSSGLRPTVASAGDLLALTHPGAAQPDVLILDVRAHAQVPSALAALKHQHPGTGVMLVALELTPAVLLDAMRGGVSECVAEPLTAENIGDAISRVVAQRTVPPGGQLFAFVGAKGGVGTTTLAVNVATALARGHSDTLLIDMHPAYGDAAVLLSAEPRFSIIDALDNTHRLDLAFFTGLTTQTDAGVTLLASPHQPPATPVDVHRIRLLLDFAVRNYRYTVVDVPRSWGDLLDAFEAAATLFIVTNQELTSVRAAAEVSEALSLRYSRDKVALLVTRFDKDAEIGTGDIEQAVHSPVRFTFPNDYRRVLHAANAGRPFALEGSAKLAGAVARFARELNGEAARDAVARPGALLARFGALRWMTS
jgi:pilus assembly protein CpaE